MSLPRSVPAALTATTRTWYSLSAARPSRCVGTGSALCPSPIETSGVRGSVRSARPVFPVVASRGAIRVDLRVQRHIRGADVRERLAFNHRWRTRGQRRNIRPRRRRPVSITCDQREHQRPTRRAHNNPSPQAHHTITNQTTTHQHIPSPGARTRKPQSTNPAQGTHAPASTRERHPQTKRQRASHPEQPTHGYPTPRRGQTEDGANAPVTGPHRAHVFSFPLQGNPAGPLGPNGGSR